MPRDTHVVRYGEVYSYYISTGTIISNGQYQVQYTHVKLYRTPRYREKGIARQVVTAAYDVG